MIPTFTLVSLGCPRTQVDAARIVDILKANKLQYVPETDSADLVIVNTCAFIQAAKEETIAAVLDACAAKEARKTEYVAVIGCFTQRYKDELPDLFPEVDLFLDIHEQFEIMDYIWDWFPQITGINNDKLRTQTTLTPKHLAYLRLADGCPHHCSFCAIPNIRGPQKSITIEAAIEQATALANQGVKELVLVAQDTTAYGLDIYGEHKLIELLPRLEEIEGIEWIRLLYLHPASLPPELLAMMSNHSKVLPYLDLPFQHINDKILHRMGRNQLDKDFLLKIKDLDGNITRRITFLVGFPGETEKQFEELAEFIAHSNYERIGIFGYSHEEGTAAYELEQLPDGVIDERVRTLNDVAFEVMLEQTSKRIGQQVKVIVDEFDNSNNCWVARSMGEAYDIDPIIIVKKFPEDLKAGMMGMVEIKDTQGIDLIAKWLNGS